MKTSIIIPTLRFQNAIDCINSIKLNTFCDYEIIVITSEELFYKFIGIPKSFVIQDNKCIGTTYAIGLGLAEATGDYVICLSDDCLVCPYWLDHMVYFLEKQPKEKIVVGNFRVFDSTGEMGTIGYYGRPFSMFPIISRKNLDKLGCYYSKEFNAYYSDPDLGMRVYENGFVKTCQTAFIYHPYNPDLLHLKNKNKYFKQDEETFIKKWGHLGVFNGCENIN